MPVLLAIMCLLAFPASADDGALADALSDASARLDQAFVDHDTDTIASLTTADHIAVTLFYGAPYTMADQLAVLDRLIITEVERSPTSTVALGSDAAMVTYENSYRGRFGDTPLSEHVFVTEIWVRQDGIWRQRLFQETPVADD
jgi:hypothetical protein